MIDTDVKGNATELLVQYALTAHNIIVSKPIISSCVYDLVADIDGRLYKIQVKHCRKSKTGITISTKSVRTKNGKYFAHKYTAKDIDYFCTIFQGNAYMIPIIGIENRNSITLAFNDTWKNGHHIMRAEDYELDTQLSRIYKNLPAPLERPHIIQQLTKSGELVGEYNSLAECPPCKENPHRISHISACINGSRKSAFGYVWQKKLYTN